MGRCQFGAGRGSRQVLRGLPAAGLQRARPAVRHGGQREARGDARDRRPRLCPCQPGLPVAVAAHSAATYLRAKRARFSRSLRPLSAQGGKVSPLLCAIGPFSGGRSASATSRGGSALAAVRPAVELQVHQVADLDGGVAAGIGARDGCRGRGARFERRQGNWVPELVGPRSKADLRRFDRAAATAAVSKAVEDLRPTDRAPSTTVRGGPMAFR